MSVTAVAEVPVAADLPSRIRRAIAHQDRAELDLLQPLIRALAYREVTVGEVVRALEGPVRIVSCMTVNDDCPQFERCNLRRPVQKIQASISSMLDTMTLAELAAEPGVPAPALAILH